MKKEALKKMAEKEFKKSLNECLAMLADDTKLNKCEIEILFSAKKK